MTIEEAKTILKLAKISCVYQHGAYAIALERRKPYEFQRLFKRKKRKKTRRKSS